MEDKSNEENIERGGFGLRGKERDGFGLQKKEEGEVSFLTVLNLAFNEEKYKGSSLSVLGEHHGIRCQRDAYCKWQWDIAIH